MSDVNVSGLTKHTQDGRFCFVDQIKTVIDTTTEKSFPWPGTGHHFIEDYGSIGSTCILPAPSRLDIPPPLLQLWAQVAVRGELGPNGEFVKWNEETWEQKRQEFAAAKPPYEDFPLPGYVATDKLQWLSSEYEATEDDKEKLRLVNVLLRRFEKSGDENGAVRWRTERAKYANELAPLPQVEKSP